MPDASPATPRARGCTANLMCGARHAGAYPARAGMNPRQSVSRLTVRTLTEITLLCAERPKPQKTGSAWMHLATLYRSLS